MTGRTVFLQSLPCELSLVIIAVTVKAMPVAQWFIYIVLVAGLAGDCLMPVLQGKLCPGMIKSSGAPQGVEG